LADPKRDPLVFSAGHMIDRVTRRRRVEKEGIGPVGGQVGKWVVGHYRRYFRRGPHKDANLLAGIILKTSLERRFDVRFGLSATEDDVAAGDKGSHLGEPCLCAQRPQRCASTYSATTAWDVPRVRPGYGSKRAPRQGRVGGRAALANLTCRCKASLKALGLGCQ